MYSIDDENAIIIKTHHFWLQNCKIHINTTLNKKNNEPNKKLSIKVKQFILFNF